MKYEFSIVGIPHYVEKDELENFYRNIIGKKVALRFDTVNLYDQYAIKVLTGDGLHIGYVRSFDVNQKVYSILQSTDRVQYAKVIRRSAEFPKSLIAEIETAHHPSSIEENEIAQREWKCSCMVLQMPKQWIALSDVMDLLLDKLDDAEASPDEVLRLLQRYGGLSQYGFSKEFYQSRTLLFDKLKAHPNPEVTKYLDLMVENSMSIHNSSLRNAAFTEIHKSLKGQITELHKDELQNFSLKRLESELAKFPHKLYQFRGKSEIFATRLYYEHMPCDILMRFLSAMAMAGVLGKGENPGKNRNSFKNKAGKKSKIGRPLKGKMGKFPIEDMMIGDTQEKNYWKPILQEMMKGKKTRHAAEVMYAAYLEGIIDSCPYAEVNASFDIGCRRSYEDEIRRLKNGGESKAVNSYREIFKKRREESRLS